MGNIAELASYFPGSRVEEKSVGLHIKRNGVKIFSASQFPEAWKKKMREKREAKFNSQKSATHEEFEQKAREQMSGSPTGVEQKGSKS